MRTPAYLSPTSINLWEQDREAFYLQYLADERPPRIPQTRPMSVGSSFDAYAKSFLHEGVFGKGFDPRFDFKTLFEAQVEPHNRDWALTAGKHCFEQYKESGALSDLMLEISSGIGKPRFELEVRGVIDGRREGITMELEGGVVLLGKPDVFFINKSGTHVVLDFKVNGYCSDYTTTPMPGYVRLRNGKRSQGQHKDCQLMMIGGVMINVAAFLEHLNTDWATQLAIYAWLLGIDIGGEFITGIDQLVCQADQFGSTGTRLPHIRIAEHRLRISSDFQWRVFAKAQAVWEIIHSDHIFRNVTKAESQQRCQALDGVASAMKGDGTALDRWFTEASMG
jgi:hypothetical protein